MLTGQSRKHERPGQAHVVPGSTSIAASATAESPQKTILDVNLGLVAIAFQYEHQRFAYPLRRHAFAIEDVPQEGAD